MSMETALRARLMADGAVAAIAGTRIDWSNRPSATQYPAVTMLIVSDPRPQHMKGFQGLRSTRVQIDPMALTPAQKVALRDAVIACIVEPATEGGVIFGRGFINNVVDRGEDVAGQGFIHRDMIDATIWHKAEN